MQTLTEARHTRDRDNMFTINLPRTRGIYSDASLYKGYQKNDDGIYWALQHSACLQDHYSHEDVAHRERLRNMKPLENGDIVMIEGKQYKTRILGNFSDCAIFDPVTTA
jgi:hypothetical protein